MPDKETNSDQSSEQSTSPQKPIAEGHQPENFIKGHQPVPLGDIFTGGYKPNISNLNPQNPPQGGSGVPPVQSSGKTSGGAETGGSESSGGESGGSTSDE